MAKKQKTKVTQLAYFEAMDRTATVEIIIGALLENHPAIKAHGCLSKKVAKIEMHLADIYHLLTEKQNWEEQ